MRQIYLITVLILLFTSSITAQQLHYGIDDSHSHVKFTGLLGDMMEVEGRFGTFWGDVFFDPEYPEELSVSLFIDPSSLNSDNEWRDKHLQNEEFLHTEAHDAIFFQSNKCIVDESMVGTLTLKDKKRTINIQYKKMLGP